MFAFAFISTARLTIRPTIVRLVRTGWPLWPSFSLLFRLPKLRVLAAAAVGSGGGTKSFAQKFFSNNNPQKTTTIANKQIALKQDNKPQKSFSMDSKAGQVPR